MNDEQKPEQVKYGAPPEAVSTTAVGDPGTFDQILDQTRDYFERPTDRIRKSED